MITKAIILAAGSSKRMRSRLPKQLIELAGKPLLAHTLDIFENCRFVDEIVLVVHKQILAHAQGLLKRYGYNKVKKICLGGCTRQQSVYNGLKRLKGCDYVIIHDGVRPVLNQEIIQKTLKAAKKFAAASCALSAVDTIVRGHQGFIAQVLPRQGLWQIQTPQAFKFDLILGAHQAARKAKIFDASDDAQLVWRMGRKVRLTQGSQQNIKVTRPLDLKILPKLLGSKK